jgi:hypothetical protein
MLTLFLSKQPNGKFVCKLILEMMLEFNFIRNSMGELIVSKVSKCSYISKDALSLTLSLSSLSPIALISLDIDCNSLVSICSSLTPTMI